MKPLIKFENCQLYASEIQGWTHTCHSYIGKKAQCYDFSISAIVGGRTFEVLNFTHDNEKEGWGLVDKKISEFDMKVQQLSNYVPYRKIQ